MSKLDSLLRRFNQELRNIAPDGYILQGTVLKRRLRRESGDRQKTYGPYYLWSRKIRNRTRTDALSAEQAAVIQQAIERNRQTERRLARLRRLSEHIIKAITVGVPKRKRRPK
jgi:hypothetical protein